MDLFGDFDWTDPAPAALVEDTASTTPIAKSIEETDESLIDSVLRGSPSQTVEPSTVKQSPTSSPDVTTSNRTKTDAASKKALDIFADLKAKHEKEEQEKREEEEAARKKMLEDSEGDESDDDLTSLLV